MNYEVWVYLMSAALTMNILTILINIRDQKPIRLNITLAIVNTMLMVYFIMRAMAN